MLLCMEGSSVPAMASLLRREQRRFVWRRAARVFFLIQPIPVKHWPVWWRTCALGVFRAKRRSFSCTRVANPRYLSAKGVGCMSNWGESAFNPRSVAVIGASAKSGKLGAILMRNLLEGYPGKLYPINPGEKEILG